MERREFMVQVGAALIANAGQYVLPHVAAAADSEKAVHLTTIEVRAKSVPIPVGQRSPFGWNVFGLEPAGSRTEARLTWPPDTAQRLAGKSATLRLRTALDVRDEKRVEVMLTNSDRVLGELDIRNAVQMQPFEIHLTVDQAVAAAREGIRLRQRTGKKPVWFFLSGTGATAVGPTLPPYLLPETHTDKIPELHQRMLSLDSVQQFGWMEGCVLDGLWHARKLLGGAKVHAALEGHLGLFFDGRKRLHYEGPLNQPYDGRVQNVEAGLPFATIARIWPDHPSLDVAEAYWRQKMMPDGTYHGADEELYTAEGAYTMAYPLAVLARVQKKPALANLAVQALLVRRNNLPHGDDLYLRARDQRRTYRNWARGYAWYLLGYARTLQQVDKHQKYDELVAEFVRVAHIALRQQQASDDLWACFLGEPETGTECGGSAGIAAALAIGVREGWLPIEVRAAAERAWRRLAVHLTPDGFLGGVSQSNCCGEEFQRSGYRVLYPPAMGLLLQLEAALM